MICTVKFIFIPNRNTNSKIVESNSEDKDTNDVLNLNLDTKTEPRQVLDAKEIANQKIDYNSKIPVEDIINNRPGYEKYYTEIIQSVEQLSEEDENFPFYHHKGYYISKVPVYHFYAIENTIGTEVQVVLFSKDLNKQAIVIVFSNNDKIDINISYSFSHIKELKESPNERYILLYNHDEQMLDSVNNLMNWGRFSIKVIGDYYHALDYKKLGVSYNELTDASKLVWIDLKNK